MNGHPEDRRKVAQFLREVRAMYPTLKGDWSRRDWYVQCATSAANLLSRLTSFRRANHG